MFGPDPFDPARFVGVGKISELITLSESDQVAHIRFSRADRLNALDVEMAETFESVINVALNETGARVVLMSGAGKSFMAGGDISAFQEAEEKETLVAAIIDPMHRAMRMLEESRVITVSAVHGPTAGAGVSLAINSDFVIAAESASFNMAYARIATTPDCGATWNLPRLVGIRKAMELVLLSETISASQALDLGLVNRLVPETDLQETALGLAKRLASGPSLAQQNIKLLLRTSLNQSFSTQLDREASAFTACAGSGDFSEGITAFLEKRRPNFD